MSAAQTRQRNAGACILELQVDMLGSLGVTWSHRIFGKNFPDRSRQPLLCGAPVGELQTCQALTYVLDS